MDVVDRYLELGLRLGRHVDGLVDAYYGPAAVRQAVDAERPVDPAALARDAEVLLRDLDEADLGDEQRERWLRAQLVGLHTVARKLEGEDLPYADEVELCYGIRPQRLPEERFEQAHRALDEALPGSGDVEARYQAWAKGLEVPNDVLLPLIGALSDDLRGRTRDVVGLPDGETTDVELVEGEPWAAFNYYQGGLRSRVVFNTDVPLHAHRLGTTVAHELYPGHHTEHAAKEALLVRGRGYRELTITLVGTPESTVSEGIAEIAAEVAVGDDEAAWTAGHARAFGIAYDPDIARRVADAREILAWVGVNVALLVHEDGASTDEAVAYARRWLLVEEPRARKVVEFVLDPTWRAYVSCYTGGERVARDFAGRDPERFRRLVTEQLTPADLAPAATTP